MQALEAGPVPAAIRRMSDGRCLMVNDAWTMVLGWRREEVLGKTTQELGMWIDPRPRQRILDALRVHGRVDDVETEFRTKSGEVRRVLASIAALELDGELCYLSQFQDITERVLLQQALERSEQRLQAFLHHAPVLATIKDAEGRLTLVNEHFDRAFAPPGATAAGQPVSAVLPQVAEAVARLDEQVLDSGEPLTAELDVSREDGTTHVYLLHKFRLDEPRGVRAVATVGTDVTAIRAAEAALLEARAASEAARARLVAVVSATTEHSVIASDASGVVTLFNAGAERLLGYSAAEMLGRRDVELIRTIHDVDELERCASALGVAMGPEMFAAAGAPREWTYVRRDGTRFPVELVVTSIRGADGRDDGYVGVARDLSAAKRLEDELRVARHEAERASRAKGDFCSHLSHELRTPLNSLLGFAQLLERSELDPDQREAVELMRDAGRHLLHLVGDALDLSLVESGQLAISPTRVRVDVLLAEVVRLAAPLAEPREIDVQLELATDGPVCAWADPQRLRQALLNLLSNAIKYNRDGGEVRVRCAAESDRVRVAVGDTGVGIAADDLERLFTPFARAASQREVEGTGLGLALTKQLLEAMGGGIHAHSEPGRGSTFELWLPLTGVETSAGHGDPPPEHGGTDGALAACVLYVEDDPGNAKLLDAILGRRERTSVVSAATGAAAVELAIRHRPDVILLDVHLPDASGEEVLARLRTDERTASIPVVAISGDAGPRRFERMLALGVVDYIDKPFAIARVLGAIDAAVRGASSAY